MKEYTHKVQYYETDKMGVTHHSNYLRIMEEARTDFMDQIGYSYEKMESDGFCSPVINVTCDYKKSTTFADVISVKVKLVELTGVKIKFLYTMTVNGVVVCEATSTHCCLNTEGRIVSLKKLKPETFELFLKYLEND